MLSVITITRNNYEELVTTLDSVAYATDIEIIVVNGGACLKTKHFLDSFAHSAAAAGIKYQSLTEPDTGIADAFNKGVRLAEGSAIVFLNSGDVLISQTYFRRAMAFLGNHPDIGFVHASIVFTDRLCGDILLRPSLSSLGRGMPYRHQTMIVRKSVFNAIGTFDTSLRATMDFDFVCRMHKARIKGYYDQLEPVVRMNGDGISSTREFLGYNEVLKILWQHRLFTPENIYGTLVRYFNYFIRRGLEKAGLKSLLICLKKRKHGVVS